MYKKVLIAVLLPCALYAADQNGGQYKEIPRLYTDQDYKFYKNKRAFFTMQDIQAADARKLSYLNLRQGSYFAIGYEQMEAQLQQERKTKAAESKAE